MSASAEDIDIAANYPFHTLATEPTKRVCAINLHLITAFIVSVARSRLRVVAVWRTGDRGVRLTTWPRLARVLSGVVVLGRGASPVNGTGPLNAADQPLQESHPRHPESTRTNPGRL